jgi:hypothetical protein
LIVTKALPEAEGDSTLVADTVTVFGDGTLAGAVKSPPVVMAPTVELPPTTPFTFQTTAVFEAFCTVAVNCLVRFTLTVALAGDTVTVTGGFTTATLTAFETPPSGLVTVTGTPLLVEEAFPVAVSLVEELKVVASGAPPNLTTAPLWNPEPLTVRAKFPT